MSDRDIGRSFMELEKTRCGERNEDNVLMWSWSFEALVRCPSGDFEQLDLGIQPLREKPGVELPVQELPMYWWYLANHPGNGCVYNKGLRSRGSAGMDGAFLLVQAACPCVEQALESPHDRKGTKQGHVIPPLWGTSVFSLWFCCSFALNSLDQRL